MGNNTELYQRDKKYFGKITRNKDIVNNRPVIAGTRIKVTSVKAFVDAGYSVPQIILEYPGLTKKDIAAAIRFREMNNV